MIVLTTTTDEAVQLDQHGQFGARLQAFSRSDQGGLIDLEKKETAFILQAEAGVTGMLHLHFVIQPADHQNQGTVQVGQTRDGWGIRQIPFQFDAL
ncbi:MAG: hypothetical protein AB1801_04070 [Chloroflexota bacterium]